MREKKDRVLKPAQSQPGKRRGKPVARATAMSTGEFRLKGQSVRMAIDDDSGDAVEVTGENIFEAQRRLAVAKADAQAISNQERRLELVPLDRVRRVGEGVVKHTVNAFRPL
jgi:phage terminase Nu1 subunit (DNA packaging protein)